MGERDELRQRSGQRRGLRRRHGGGAADGAGRVEPEPCVDAGEVEEVPAIRHHPQHLPLPVLAEADGADGVGLGGLAEGELGVGAYGRLIQARGGAAAGAFLLLLLLVFLGDEDDVREPSRAARV